MKTIYQSLIYNLMLLIVFFTLRSFSSMNNTLHIYSPLDKIPSLRSLIHTSDQSTQPTQNTYKAGKYKKDIIQKKPQALTKNERSESEPWSNAFNFKKTWGTQIDPRTGILSTFVKTGSMVSNLGHGPDINLEINYSSISTANPDGLGQGWRWNLTHFNPQTNQLVTSGGQNFHLQRNNDGRWLPLYHKLKDVHILKNKNNGFVIVYANGLKETLNSNGYEIQLEQQNGWRVKFSYLKGTHLLHAIADEQGNQINFLYYSNYITVISRGTQGEQIKIRISNPNEHLTDITLPSQPDSTEVNLHINYMENLINQINYPTGARKKFVYSCQDAIRLPVTVKSSAGSLCAVSEEHVVTDEQHQIVFRYQYSQANVNKHDYLGFNSGLTFVRGSNRDILFEAPVDYTYRTSEDNNIVKEIRTYNKYHLLIDDKKISDHTGHLLSEVQNFYCRTDEVNGCSHTSFDDLPATYSLPLKTVTKLWGILSDQPALSSVTRSYDDQGRIITTKDSYGRTTQITYCPGQGDIACPVTPDHWFSTLPEKVTAYPAKTDTITSLPITTYNYYRKEPNHNGDGYALVLDHQIYNSGHNRMTIIKSYYNDPGNVLTYGLLKKTVLTGTTSETPASVTKDYWYTESADFQHMTVHSIIEMDQNKSQTLPSVTTSLFTHQVLQQVDALGKNITRYHYDLWGRLVQTDLAVGTPFAAHRYYQYTLSPTLNQIVITAENGLKRKMIFNSVGNELMRFDEALSSTGKAVSGQWLLKYKNTYDNYNRLVTKSAYIINTSGKTEVLSTTYHYDDMGITDSVHFPNGETAIKLYDDQLHCTVNYRLNLNGQHSTVSVVLSNTLDEPVQHIVLPTTQAPLPSVKTLCTASKKQQDAKTFVTAYDGWGRVVSVTDTLGRVTRKHYDAFGQTDEVTDPAGNKLHFVFNLIGQITQTWTQPVTRRQYLLSSAKYNAAGQLLWNAGEDGRHTTYAYTPDGKPSMITTPAGHRISWQYNGQGLPVSQYADGKLLLQMDYDRITTQLIRKTDITGVTTWTYSDDALPLQEIHQGANDYPNYRLQWQYDQNRRLISVTDIHGYKTFTHYDALGRIASLYYQNHLLFSPVYDAFSRTIAIHYGSGMYRTIRYDDYGHPSWIRDRLSKKLLSQWNYAYDTGDNIIRIEQQAEDHKKGIIRYQYDKLNNLVSMRCNGSAALPLCPHDTDLAGSGLQNAPVITRQDYRFTALNRIAQVKEVLQNASDPKTLRKIVTYDYSDAKVPLRLQSISTAWNENHPVTKSFSYDVAGNIIVDGEGNQVTYNAFNQVTKVIQPGGAKSIYTYDGTGKEAIEKTFANTHYLFYQDNTLINESINSFGQPTHTTGYYNIARTMDGIIDQYYERNYKGDVCGILTKDSSHVNHYKLSDRNVYSPYGMSWHSTLSSVPWYQKVLSGFNSERTDPVTGWQFLGAGHRTYNPQQRSFISEDPAGGGYNFGSNNPIMNTDPAGNMPKWLSAAFTGLNYLTTFGLAAVHKQWANITAAVVLAGLSIFSAELAPDTLGGALAMTAVTASVSSVPIIAAAIPANKGLNIAAAASGGIEMTVTLAAGIVFAYDLPYDIEAAETSRPMPGSATSLGRRLREGDKTLRITTIWSRLERKGVDYLTLESDDEVEKAATIIRRVRPLACDQYTGIALIAAKVSDKPLNLNIVESYLDTIETFRTTPQTDLYSKKMLGDILHAARVNLLEQFGQYQTKQRFLFSHRYLTAAELLRNKRNKMIYAPPLSFDPFVSYYQGGSWRVNKLDLSATHKINRGVLPRELVRNDAYLIDVRGFVIL